MSTNTRSNDPGRTEALLENADWLRRLARRLVLDDGEAEDVLQDAWLAARAHPAPAGVATGAWLAGFVRNAARGRRRTEARRRGRERDAAHAEAVPSVVDDAERLEIHRALIDRVEALPEAQRRAIVARYLEGHPPRRIARDEGVPVATVHSRIQRGLEALRSDLDAQHGDRRTWAAWIAPVAGVPRWTRGGLVAGLVGAAAVMTAVVATTLAVGGEGATPDAVDAVTAAHDVNEAVTAPVVVQDPAPNATDESNSVARTPAITDPLVIRVVDADGAPAPGVAVLAASSAALEERFDPSDLLNRSPEGILHDFGERLETNDDGVVEIELATPAVVWAGDEDRAGQVLAEAGRREATVELTRAPRLTVRVLDDDGEPIDSGFDIGVRTQASWKGGEGNADYELRSLVDGRAFVQDITSFISYPQAEGEVVRYRSKLVHVHVPGAAESGRGAKELSFRFAGRIGKPRTIDLTLPPMGSVQFVVNDGGSGIARVDGTVSLRFPRGDASGDWPLDYEAELVDGIAVFPRFVTNAGPFRAHINVPSKGATWIVQDVGPSEEGERKRISTTIPTGRRVEVTVVDADGAPLSDVELYLCLGVHETGGHMDSRSGRSNAAGRAVFLLDERVTQVFPLRLEAQRLLPGRWEKAVASFETAEAGANGAIDLGEVPMVYRAPTSISGRVVDDEGQPIARARVGVLGTGGSGSFMETRQDGTFSSLQVVQDEARIVLRRSGDWLETTTVVPAADLGEPIVVVATRAAALEARLDLSPYEFDQRPGRLVLRDATGEAVASGSVDADGHVRVGGLKPGTYDVGIHMRGNVALTTVPGVTIAAGETARDDRIDAFRLRDHVREIEVVATGLPERYEPQMSADAIGGGENPSVHLTYQDEPYLIPLHVPCRLRFTSYPKAPVVIEDSTTVEDRVEITFVDPKRVTLRLTGTISPNETLTLLGIVGTPTQGCSIGADPAKAKGGLLSVELPAEGSYRVARSERDRPAGGRMVMMAVPQPTDAVVELAADATVDVQVDAPYLPR